MQHPAWVYILLAALAGISFALIPVSYRLGQMRGIQPFHIVLLLALAGLVFFGGRALTLPLREVPARVWCLGCLSGAGQYLAVRGIRAALKRGPLSPLWCAVSLAFLPVIIDSRIRFHEHLDLWQKLGLAAGILSIVIASRASQTPVDPADRTSERRAGTIFTYGLLLAVVLLGNGMISLAVKDLTMHLLPTGTSYYGAFSPIFLVLSYGILFAGVAFDLYRTGQLRFRLHPTLLLGAMAAGGSICGIWLMGISAVLPAAVVFTVLNIASLLAAALVSVALLGERPTRTWAAMMVSGVASVILVNVSALFR